MWHTSTVSDIVRSINLGLNDLPFVTGCYVSTGGYIERVLSTSGGDKSIISKYLTACKDVGYAGPPIYRKHGFNSHPRFDVLELSSGFLSIPTDDWASLIEFTAAHGLKPKPEVGIQ